MNTDERALRSERARERIEILDGLLAVLDNRERLFDVLDASEDADAARVAVMREFALNEVQAHAALDIQVWRLVPKQRDSWARERAELARQL